MMRFFLKMLMGKDFKKLEAVAHEAMDELRDYETRLDQLDGLEEQLKEVLKKDFRDATIARRQKQAEAAEKRAQKAEAKAQAARSELDEERRAFKAEKANRARPQDQYAPPDPVDVSVLKVPDAVAMSVEDAHAACEAGKMSDDILRSFVAESGDGLRLIVEWLIEHSTPDDRDAMLGLNWDHGLFLFHWIISQPDTDVATALKAAWMTEPSYHIGRAAAGQSPHRYAMQIAPYDFLVQITQRVNAGFYNPGSGHVALEFAPDRKVTWDREDPAFKAAEEKLLPAQAFVPIEGRKAQPRLPDGLDWDVLC